MDFDLRWLFIAASLGLCAWAGWQFVHRLARARLLGDVPTSRIRSAAQGFVELYGVLEEGPEGPLQAPLTGKPCLWWRYRIEVEEGAAAARRPGAPSTKVPASRHSACAMPPMPAWSTHAAPRCDP